MPLLVQQQTKKTDAMSSSGGTSNVNVRRSASSPGRKASPRRAPSREQESSIRRGAEIIRRQIQSQLAEMGEKLQHRSSSSSQPHDTSGTSNTTGPHPAVVEPEPAAVERVVTSSRRSTSSKRQHQWNKEFSWKPASSGSESNGQQRSNNKPLNQQHVGASNQLERQNNRSGDTFSDFSDPWKREPTGKRLQSQHEPKEPVGKLQTSVEVGPPTTGWDELNVSAVNLSQDYGLPPKPSQPTTHSGKAILRSYPVTMVERDCDCMSDSASDINTVSEPLFDPFAERDLLPPSGQKQQSKLHSSSAPKRNTATKSVSASTTKNQQVFPPAIVSPVAGSKNCMSNSDIFTYDEGSRKAIAVSPASPDRAFSSCSSSSSSVENQQHRQLRYPQINPATGAYEDKDKSHNVRMSVAGSSPTTNQSSPPRQQQQQQQQKRSGYLPVSLSPARGTNNNNKSSQPNQQQQMQRLSRNNSSGSDDDDGEYQSPTKATSRNGNPPISAVVASPGGVVSQLTTPNKNKPRYGQTSQMLQRYHQLLESDAYRHAANAGFLWQSMVGQHVRFPDNWWDGERGPPLGCGVDSSSDTDAAPGKWMYLNRQTVSGNPVLNQLVKCRASGGRLLLHIIVQDLMTRTPVQDVVIGCFHPNAKGIRESERALGRLEHCRDVWIAVRKRSSIAVSAVDSLLYNSSNDDWLGSRDCDDWVGSRSPLGRGRRVTNTNVRSVFGEKSPLETIFVAEDELYERLSARILHQPVPVTPAMAILQEFVFA